MTTHLTIQGMQCAGCAGSVEAALRRVPGVRAVTVSLDQGAATVEHDATQPPDALAAAVARLGYEVRVARAA